MATASHEGASHQLDLLVTGKTGHGKSSTGNAILGRSIFEVSDGALSETSRVQVGWSRRFDREIKVVDSPGFFENRFTKAEWMTKGVKNMEECFLQCPQGFHALLLVFKYGNRFTEEELQTVEILKAIFGQDFVRKYCVLIFTNGESFDLNNQSRTFSAWCKEQRGALRNILMECNFKAVLFYNNTEEKTDSQVRELLALVDDISRDGTRYKCEIFQRAAEEREKLIVRENAPQMREEIQAKINLLVDSLEKLKTMQALDKRVQYTVNTLKADCTELLQDIDEKDKGTGVLDSLRRDVQGLSGSITNQEEILKAKEEKARMEEQLLKRERELQEQRSRMQKEHEEQMLRMQKEHQEQSLRMQQEQEQQNRKMIQELQEKRLQMQREQQQREERMQREWQQQMNTMSRHLEQQRRDTGERQEKSGFWSKAGNFAGALIGGVISNFIPGGGSGCNVC